MESRLREKVVVEDGRISPKEGLYLLTKAPLAFLSELATSRRRRKVGEQVFYQHNVNINHTNICRNRCPLCAFYRSPADGFTMTVDEVVEQVVAASKVGVKEVHIVGGLNDNLSYDYYLELLRRVKGIGPDIRVQGFTAVEIDYLTKLSGKPLDTVLLELKEAGLDCMPGGGAEIFAERVRKKICPNKISAERWLEVSEHAHRVGIKTNATMLYGHIETPEEVIDHLNRLRELQDRTRGFGAFVPLAFFSRNTGLSWIRPETFGLLDMRILATARVFLDNFDHIKSLWMTLGAKAFQAGLEFGADDMGATYYDELIVHSAGAKTPRGLTERELRELARRAGRQLVETYSDYQMVSKELPGTNRGPAPVQPESNALPEEVGLQSQPLSFPTSRTKRSTLSALEEKIVKGERLSPAEGLELFRQDLWWLGKMAGIVRQRMVPGNRVTFVVDRIVNVTNVCTCGCKFCAYHVGVGDPAGYVLSVEEVLEKVAELAAAGGTQVMLQGGLNPACGLSYYEQLLRELRRAFPGIYRHCLSPPEIDFLARREGLSTGEVLRRLREAGLQSVAGGGAEILVDRVRRIVSPNKLSSQGWLDVMREVHAQGMKGTATMVFGLVETEEERLAHLDAIRTLQDETGVFRAFIPWTFCPANTYFAHVVPAGGAEYLRTLAVSRIYLDNIVHIASGTVTEGMKMAQLGLMFGADDMGGVVMEEQVLRCAGVEFKTRVEELFEVIRYAGFVPVIRNTKYEPLSEHS